MIKYKFLFFDTLKIFILVIFSIHLVILCNIRSMAEEVKSTGSIEQYLFVGHGKIFILNFKNNDNENKHQNIIYKYDKSDIIIDSPSFFSENNILFAKNVIAENNGFLIIYNFINDIEKIIYKGRSIKSPVISNDGKKVAFLSDRMSENNYSLYMLDIHSLKITKLVNKYVIGAGYYNYNISWSPDSKNLFYTDSSGYIISINIVTGKKKKILFGFNPICSPYGDKIIFSESKNKPYEPIIYDLAKKTKIKLKVSRVLNAVWMPTNSDVLIVKEANPVFGFNEWNNEVSVKNYVTGKTKQLFSFEGFEYIDCKKEE